MGDLDEYRKSLARRADTPADKAHLHADAERWLYFADRLDYSIRRWVIPAEDGLIGRPVDH
jgi:hypothetical protein